MLVEVSPNWDGRNKGVTYMETFGRLMAGVAPWLTLPDDDTEEGQMRKQLREWALKSYANAVDPANPDYLLWRGHGQALVDAAYVAESFLRAYDQLWMPLDDTTKKRYFEEFTQLRRVDPPYTNWLLFLLPSRVSWQRQERNVTNTVSIRLSARWRNGTREMAGMRTALLSLSTIIAVMSSIPCIWKRCRA